MPPWISDPRAQQYKAGKVYHSMMEAIARWGLLALVLHWPILFTLRNSLAKDLSFLSPVANLFLRTLFNLHRGSPFKNHIARRRSESEFIPRGFPALRLLKIFFTGISRGRGRERERQREREREELVVFSVTRGRKSKVVIKRSLIINKVTLRQCCLFFLPRKRDRVKETRRERERTREGGG